MLLIAVASPVAADYGAGVAAYRQGDYAAAFGEFRSVAEQGDADAQFALGFMYRNGQGVPEDFHQAVLWYRKAAEQGSARAQYYLGLMYDYGEGVLEDDARAVVLYRQAAEQDHAEAQHYLGLMYDYGEGVPEDDVHAYAWFNLAAAQGHEEAEQARDFSRLDMTKGQTAQAQRFSRELAAWIVDGGGRPSPTLVTAQKEPTEPMGSGSGFLVGRDGSVVTNHHVVDGCARVTVHRAGISHDAKIRAVDDNDDLALLTAPLQVGETATFSESPRTRLGAAVTVAGYPLRELLSSELNVTSGNVSALAGLDDDPTRLQITAPVQKGSSGGPLLDSAGNVVGIVVSKLHPLSAMMLTGDVPQNVSFAIKGTLVRSFLDIHGVAYRRRPSTAALASERIAELAHTFTVAIHCWE